jgi:hypothetical protein
VDEEVVVAGAADGLKITPVKTICNKISVGWPEYEVSTVVAWSDDPQLY